MLRNDVIYGVIGMPPKPKITHEQVLQKAFELTRTFGFEQMTARGLAQALGCSTEPIFRLFENMNGIKRGLYEKTREFMGREMAKPMENTPLFLSMGLRYVELAQKEQHLFRLLCMSDSFHLDSLFDITKGVQLMDPRLFAKVWIFTHGIASIVSTNRTAIRQDEIRTLLVEAYTAFSKEEGNYDKHDS
jgi:AcrR family transcriptional regulator